MKSTNQINARGAAALVTGMTVLVSLSLTACSAGPSVRPEVAVAQNSGGSAAAADSSTSAAAPTAQAPALETPKTDLTWRDCTSATLAAHGLGAARAGLVLECSEFQAPIDAAGQVSGDFTVGVLRARLTSTPPDAAPLVFTSGSDASSVGSLAALANGVSTELIGSHPVVAVDRRGIGASTPIDCIPTATRQAIYDLTQFERSSADPADRVAQAGRDATIACTDFLSPQAFAFDTAHAADDLEQLRQLWGTNTLGVIGSGNGALVALAYAAQFPTHLARLILDSPTGIGVAAATLAEQRVQGQEAALTAFAQQCVGLGCSLGNDPRAAVADLVRRAGSGEFGGISAHAVLVTLSAALASTVGDAAGRVLNLSNTLSALGRGDTVQFAAAATPAQAATESDGQFVSQCIDGGVWPSPDRAKALQTTWSTQYPVFGADAALSTLLCSSWPTSPASKLPGAIAVPVLSVVGTADPVAGNGGFPSVTGAVVTAGAKSASVTWQGSGHPALAGSACVQAAAVSYAADAGLPADGTPCPA